MNEMTRPPFTIPLFALAEQSRGQRSERAGAERATAVSCNAPVPRVITPPARGRARAALRRGTLPVYAVGEVSTKEEHFVQILGKCG